MIRLTLLTAAVCAALTCTASADLIYNDEDVPTGSTVANNGTLANVADPVLPGTAGELSDLTAKFSSVATGPIGLPATAPGNPFSVSVDYLIPTGTQLNDGDLIYLQLNVDGANRGSVGFANAANVPRDEWQTLTIDNLNFPGGAPDNGPNLPAGSSTIEGALIIADNGFGAGNDFPGGLALLVDNLRIDVTTVPEPTALLLTLLASCVGFIRIR